MSYSHADGRLAPALQEGLQSLAKPWYRRRSLRIFRDETSLSGSPELWGSLEGNLADCHAFILLASPEAAASRWVEQEVAWWRANRGRETFLIALTAGSLEWDELNGDFAPDAAVPESLRRWFESEPLWVDLRWARTADHVSLRNPQFRNCVADLAAPLHGVAKDALVGEDIRQHRRALRLAWSAAAVLTLLAIVATIAAVLAVVARREAIEQRDVARSRELAARADSARTDDPVLSLSFAVHAVETRRTPEAALALRRSLASPLRFDLHGQTARVSHLVFSPDGRRLAQTGHASVVRVWDLVDGGPPLVLGGHTEPNPAIGFAADGRHVVTASGGEARVWELERPRDPVGVDVPASAEVALSPDGTTVAAATYDGALVLQDVQDSRTRQVLRRAGGAPVAGLEFSADGKRLLGADDGGIWVWPVERRAEPLSIPAGNVRQASWTREGGIVAVAARSFAEYSNSGAKRRAVRIRIPTGSVAAVDARRRRVAVGGPAAPVAVWNLVGDPPRVLQGTAGVTALAWAPDGRMLATAGEGDGTLRIWDTSAVPLVPRAPAVSSAVTAPVFSPDGDLVAAADYSAVKVWPVAGGRPRVVRTGGHEVLAFAFTRRGDRILTLSDDGYVRVAPPTDARGRQGARLGRPRTAAFSPDGTRVATVDATGSLVLWDVRGRRRVMLGRRAGGASIAFAPDGRTIATADGTSTIRIWSTAGGHARVIRAPAAAYTCAFDASGMLLAVPAGRSLYLWRVDELSRAPRLVGRYGRFANAVAFSPRTNELAAGGTPGELRIWNLDDGGDEPLVLADGYSVDGLAYSPAGTRIATISNGNVHIWTCLGCGPIDDLIGHARGLLPREINGLTAVD